MKEIKQEIIVRGTPRIENMPKEDFNVLCTSLLRLVEDYYKDYEYKKEENKPARSSNPIQVFPQKSDEKIFMNFFKKGIDKPKGLCYNMRV